MPDALTFDGRAQAAADLAERLAKSLRHAPFSNAATHEFVAQDIARLLGTSSGNADPETYRRALNLLGVPSPDIERLVAEALAA